MLLWRVFRCKFTKSEIVRKLLMGVSTYPIVLLLSLVVFVHRTLNKRHILCLNYSISKNASPPATRRIVGNKGVNFWLCGNLVELKAQW